MQETLPQLLGLQVAAAFQPKRKTGGERRREQIALPNTFLVFSFETHKHCAEVWGSAQLSDVVSLGEQPQEEELRKQQRLWNTVSHVAWRGQTTTPLAQHVDVPRAFTPRLKSVEFVRPCTQVDEVTEALGCAGFCRYLRVPRQVAEWLFSSNGLRWLVTAANYVVDAGLPKPRVEDIVLSSTSFPAHCPNECHIV